MSRFPGPIEHDHEQDQDDDAAGVDDDLRRAQKLRVQRDVQNRQRHEVHEQKERAMHRHPLVTTPTAVADAECADQDEEDLRNP